MVFCGLKQMFTFVSLSEFILHGGGSLPLWLFNSGRLSLTCAMCFVLWVCWQRDILFLSYICRPFIGRLSIF